MKKKSKDQNQTIDNKPKMGRPKVEIDIAQIKGLCRLSPTLKDVAAFFECSEDTIERHIKEYDGSTFAEFKQKNMVHTRFSLIRKAISMAENGNTGMVIFCLKNLCGWKDRYEENKEHDEMINHLKSLIQKLSGLQPDQITNLIKETSSAQSQAQ